MERKEFFKKRNPSEMQAQLAMTPVDTQSALVERIRDLDPATDGIVLQVAITPYKFFQGSENGAAASRKNYKHGSMIVVDQPKSKHEAQEFPHTPLQARMSAIDAAFRNVRQEDIDFIGITWQPVQGNDRRWRVVPFDVPVTGVKIYDYAVHRTEPIEVDDRYTSSPRVETEGAKVYCTVPSMEVKAPRYHITLEGVPIVAGKEASAVVLSLKSQYEEGREPERVTFLHHLRYERQSSQRDSDIFVFGPHDVAAYLAVIRKYWKEQENMVPLNYSPFPLPSKQFVTFSEKLDNNVLMHDPTLASKSQLRNLHLDEKCILLARAVKVMGPWETLFCNAKRDGKLADYWQ